MNTKFQILDGSLPINDSQIHGNLTLNLFPVTRPFTPLPSQFGDFQRLVDQMLLNVPWDKPTSNLHYVTIDSKFFTQPSALRREGLHIDGNFCADPNFQYATWGGTTWSGTRGVTDENGNFFVETPFVSPYGIKPPIGTYVSADKGGILTLCSYSGCDVYSGEMDFEVGNEGNVEPHRREIMYNGTHTDLEKGVLYFMSSNTPHESKIVPAGVRRTLIRVTLAHDYNNALIAA